MTHDFDLYERQLAESILAGTSYCFFCGIGQPEPEERDVANNLLCPLCSPLYDMAAHHEVMCVRIRDHRSRLSGILYRDPAIPCMRCEDIANTRRSA